MLALYLSTYCLFFIYLLNRGTDRTRSPIALSVFHPYNYTSLQSLQFFAMQFSTIPSEHICSSQQHSVPESPSWASCCCEPQAMETTIFYLTYLFFPPALYWNNPTTTYPCWVEGRINTASESAPGYPWTWAPIRGEHMSPCKSVGGTHTYSLSPWDNILVTFLLASIWGNDSYTCLLILVINLVASCLISFPPKPFNIWINNPLHLLPIWLPISKGRCGM